LGFYWKFEIEILDLLYSRSFMNLNLTMSVDELKTRMLGFFRSPRVRKVTHAIPKFAVILFALACIGLVAYVFNAYAYIPSKQEVQANISLPIISEEQEFIDFKKWIEDGPRALQDAQRETYKDPFK